MPVKILTTQDSISARRVLIIGPPASLKTTSLVKCADCKTVAGCDHAWPRPQVILSAPGEKGWETVPTNIEGITSAVWEWDDVTKQSPHAMIREFESMTWKLLATPGLQSFCVDGLHKLYPWYYKRRRLEIAEWKVIKDSEEANERQLDLTAYGNENSGAYAEFMLYVTKVCTSPVPYVAMTVWEGLEPDDVGSRSSHVFADLAGKLARRVVGEFSVCLYSSVTQPDPQGRVKGKWLLRPQGKVWGIGYKANPDIALSVPSEMPQNFRLLERTLKG